MIFLICFMMLVKPVVPVFEYIFNYEYITTKLCINKDNYIIGCDGKCYLVKQLAKASENEKPLSSDKKQVATETTDLFVATFIDCDLAVSINPNQKPEFSTYSNLYSHLNSDAFFHPPTVIS